MKLGLQLISLQMWGKGNIFNNKKYIEAKSQRVDRLQKVFLKLFIQFLDLDGRTENCHGPQASFENFNIGHMRREF